SLVAGVLDLKPMRAPARSVGLSARFVMMPSRPIAQARRNMASPSVGTLPGTDPISGTHTYWLTRADQKALRILGAHDTGNDGTVSFSNLANRFDYDRTDGITSGLYDFAGTVAHEFTEIMGRSLLV